MKRLMTVLWVLLLTFAIQDAGSAEKPERGSDENPAADLLSSVLGVDRPRDADILILRDGDKLSGTILNESFSATTFYAGLEFNRQIVAGIDLNGGPDHIESVITVNNNRFSGFIHNPAFIFKLQQGPEVEIRCEKVSKAVFRIRDGEPQSLPEHQFIILKNGDFFSGKILNDELTTMTPFAGVPLELNNVDSITFLGGKNQKVEVAFKDGGRLQGALEQEDIQIELDIGPTIKIYQDRINTIYGREGSVPGIKPSVAAQPLIRLGENDKMGYGAEFEDGRLKIIKIAEGSPVEKAGLQVGDQIVAIDGQELDSDDAVRKVRDDILAGNRQQALIDIRRGDETKTYRLMK